MKIYTDRVTGERVQIMREEADYYVLSNKASIKKNIFGNKFDEAIDPVEFLNPSISTPDLNPLVNLANQLKSMDTAKMSNEDQATRVKYKPATVLADDSKSEARVVIPQIDDTENIVLSEEQRKVVLEKWKRDNPSLKAPEQVNFKENANGEIEYEIVKGQAVPVRDEIPAYTPPPDQPDSSPTPAGQPPQITQQASKEDPIQALFKLFENNYPVNISIDIEDYIPDPTFMGAVMKNVKIDVVDYYAKIILDKFLKDTSAIQKEIYNQLKESINKELKLKPVIKPKKKVTPKKKTNDTK